MALIKIEMTADDAKAFAAWKRQQEQQDRLNEKLRQTKDTAKKAGDDLQDAGQKGARGMKETTSATDQALTKVVEMAASYVSVTAAVQTATSAIRDMKAASEEAANASKATRPGFGALAQLADTPQELRRLQKASDELYAAGGAPDRNAAAETVFALQSTGSMADFEYLKQASAAKLFDVAPMTEAANALRSALGPAEAGTVRQLVSKGLAAGAEGTGTASDFLQAAAAAGPSAAALKVRDEELLAAAELMSQTVGGASEAGTLTQRFLGQIEKAILSEKEADTFTPERLHQDRVRRLEELRKAGDLSQRDYITQVESSERQMMQQRIAGKTGGNLTDRQLAALESGTFAEKLDVIQEAGGLDSPAFREHFRDTEPRKAYRLLESGRERYDRYLTEIDQAQETDLAGRRLKLAQEVPEMSAARAAEQAQAREMLSRRDMGIRENIADAIQDERAAQMRTGRSSSHLQGFGEWGTWGLGKADSIERWMFGDDWYIRRQMTLGNVKDPGLANTAGQYMVDADSQSAEAAQAARDQAEAARDLKESAADLRRATDNLRRPAGNTLSDPRIDR